MLARALTISLVLTTSAIVGAENPEEQKAERPRSLAPTEQELETFQLTWPTLTPIPDASPLFGFSGFGMFAASAADFATTEAGLASGLREGNPVASERGVRLLHHVVGPAAVWWTTEKLQRSGRTKLAVSLRIAVMIAYSYAAIHNVRLVQGGVSAP